MGAKHHAMFAGLKKNKLIAWFSFSTSKLKLCTHKGSFHYSLYSKLHGLANYANQAFKFESSAEVLNGNGIGGFA